MSLQPFAHAWVVETHAPIYVLHVPATFSDAEFEGFIGRLDAWIAMADEAYAWVMGSDSLLNAKQRKMVADSDKRRSVYRGSKLGAGVAFVVPNASLRGVLTAILWLAPPQYRNILVQSPQEGLVWAQRQLGDFQI